MKKIAVIGSLNVDYDAYVDKQPVMGETVLSRGFMIAPGGKGANQAVACAKLGGNTVFLSALGNGGDEKVLTDMFDKVSLDWSRVKRVEGLSGCAYIAVDSHAQNSIIVIPGANSLCDCEYLKSCLDAIDEASIVLLSMEIPFDTVLYACRYAHEKGKTVVLNPAPAPLYMDAEIYQYVDYLTPNETELEKLSGFSADSEENIRKAAQALLAKGVRALIVTLGDKGSMFVDSRETFIVPSLQVKAVDTTAAGDTYNGALCVKLAEGASVRDAMAFASKAASISVTRKGAQPSIPSRCEVE